MTGTIIEVRDITQEKLAQQAHEAALRSIYYYLFIENLALASSAGDI